ncbi:MAG: KH domain-containing protein [Candidatus Sumerlaeota bacterium]|nr:KH domain-containing protein [Candidatus Sumerlaeota bacterium]
MARMIYAGATLEEAMERASKELGLPADMLESEVLEDNRGKEVSEEEAGVCVRVRPILTFAAQKAAEILRGLLNVMEVENQVEVRTAESSIHIMILAPKSSVLIGREGQTLDSIQHWLTRAVAKVVLSAPRITLDVENYRSRKFSRLEKIAKRLAKTVLQSGKPARMDPMGPVDRKFIHNCLKNFEGVTTFSLGREGRRHVVISPKDAAKGRRIGRDEEDEMEDEEEGEEEEAFTDEDLISTGSAYSKLRVIARPTSGDDSGDEEIEDELSDKIPPKRKSSDASASSSGDDDEEDDLNEDVRK